MTLGFPRRTGHFPRFGGTVSVCVAIDLHYVKVYLKLRKKKKKLVCEFTFLEHTKTPNHDEE